MERAITRAFVGLLVSVLQSPAPTRRLQRDVPTNIPPPYFPQNQLSPGDEKTARKLRLTFYGCGLLLVVALVAAIVGVVYLIRSLM